MGMSNIFYDVILEVRGGTPVFSGLDRRNLLIFFHVGRVPRTRGYLFRPVRGTGRT